MAISEFLCNSTDDISVNDLVKSAGVNGLEAGPPGPEFPVRDNGRGDWDAQFLFVGEDTSGIIGSEDGGDNARQPADKVEVVLTRPRATKESFRGKLSGNDVEDQVTDVCYVGSRNLEQSVLGFFRGFVLVDFEETAVRSDLLVIEGFVFCGRGGSRDTFEGSLAVGKEDSGDAAGFSLELLIVPGQKEGKVRVIFVLVNESSELGRLGNRGRGDRIQVGNDGRGVSVDVGTSGQSGESGFGVELEEGGLEVFAVHEADGLELNIDAELSNGNLGNGSPDGVGESVDGWLCHC